VLHVRLPQLLLLLALFLCPPPTPAQEAEAPQAKPAETESGVPARISAADPIRDMQTMAIAAKKSDFAWWGTDPSVWSNHTSHSNRLIPVYTFGTKGAGPGIDLDSWFGPKSVYRSEDALQKIYGYLPERTVNSSAIWMDQTNVYDIQLAAAAAGKKHIFLVVFDGMDCRPPTRPPSGIPPASPTSTAAAVEPTSSPTRPVAQLSLASSLPARTTRAPMLTWMPRPSPTPAAPFAVAMTPRLAELRPGPFPWIPAT